MKPAQATQFHLSLSLELLKGCQFSCAGCHVNKEGAQFSGTQLVELEFWLDSMVKDGNYLPTIVFIAPTDFLTASNTIDVLTNSASKAILQRFRRLSLQTTYLNLDNAEKIIDVLRDHYSHMELELNFVIEPGQLDKIEYLKKIKAAREKFYRMLDWQMPVLSFCILNVYEYDRIKRGNAKKILKDYQVLHDRIKDLFGCTIDFNFSMLRNNWWSNEDVEAAVKSISNIFDEGIASEFGQSLRFSFGNLDDSRIEKHYNWHAGHLYTAPMVYERIASFHESLRIPLNISRGIQTYVERTESFEERQLVRQYESSKDKPDCKDCPYLGPCVDRGILTFMDMYGIKNCIIARKAVDAINVIK